MANTVVAIVNTVAVGTAGLALNAVTPLVRVPKGFTVLHATLEATDMDSGTALVLAVGDADDNDRLMTGLTTGQAGGISNALAVAGFPYRYTEDTTINLTATTAAGTAVAGTVSVSLLGVIDA
jgi:hypothetical protein